MTAKKIGTVMAVFFTAVCVRAADRTWNGGGGDAKWSTSANWGGTAPTTNDTLFFSGTAQLTNTNDLPDDTPFAGITFKSDAGGFTLSGSRISLGGSVTNFSANTQTINLPVSLPDTGVFNASNGAITVNGALSGAGGLVKLGPKTLTLASSNSYDGVTAVTNGILWITNANALGSTNGNTVVCGYQFGGNGNIQLSGGIVVPEPLVLNGERSGNASSLYNSGGSNMWSGPITRSNQIRIHGAGSSTLAIKGGLTGGGGLLVLNSPGIIAFYEKPINVGTDTLYLETSGGTTVIGVSGNTWGATRILNNVCTLRLDVADALPAATSLQLGYDLLGARACTLNLNGFNQTVGQLFNYPKSMGIHTITTPTPATLTVNQSSTNLYGGQLDGALSLAKTGTGTLILSNSLSSTTGSITVTNGTLVAVLPNSLGNSTNVTVSGGTLELRTSSGIADTASLSITNNGRVNIGTGLVETVDKLFLDGVQQKSGSWGTAGSGAANIDNIHFSGTGKINVLSAPPATAVNAVWNAEGTDTFMSTTNNWEGDALPAFDGTTYAVFGTGGTEATVDTAVSLYGMTFNRDGAFTLANGSGAVTLGAGGLAAAIPSTTSRTYTLAEDLTLAENSTWDVATNGTGVTTLTVSGRINNGLDPRGFTKSGNGTLILSGSNSYDGVTTVNNGMITLTHGSALGSTNGNTVINGPSGGCVQLSGNLVVAEPLVLNGERVNPFGTGGLWSLYSSGSNTLSGPLVRQGQQTRIQLAGGSSLVVRGGVTGGNSQCVVTVTTSTGGIAFYDKPVNIGAQTLYFEMAGSGLAVIGVAENTWGVTRLAGSGGILRLDIANALPAATSLDFGYSNQVNNFTVDLNGFDQTIGQVYNNLFASGAQIITSPTPATLTVNQNTDRLFFGQMSGALGLTKIGTGTLTLSNSLSTLTGNITVTNGTLAVAKDNSLGNSTNITVTGAAARLELRASSGISDAATLVLANDGAKVNLEPGVNEAVGWLYFGDKIQRAGTYGSTLSGASSKDDAHFSGTGILTVRHDRSGTLVRLR